MSIDLGARGGFLAGSFESLEMQKLFNWGPKYFISEHIGTAIANFRNNNERLIMEDKYWLLVLTVAC